MNALSILPYGGIAALLLLLTVFELQDRQGGSHGNSCGYVYYAHNNVVVRIRHLVGTRYKVYVYDSCPVQTKKDRYGTYFILKARSASDAEHQIDELYRNN